MRDKWYTQSPPSERETYLVTDNTGNIQIAKWTNYSPILGDESDVWRWVGLMQYTHVIAWRILPEAYKED